MDYPKFILSNQKEESISIQRVKCMNLYISGTYFARDATYAHNYSSRNGLVNLGSVGGGRSIFPHMLLSSYVIPGHNTPQTTASNSSSFFPSLHPYILAHGQQQSGFQLGSAHNSSVGQPQQSGFQFGNTSNTVGGQPQQSGFQFGNTSNTVSGQPQQSGFQFGNTSNTASGQPQQSGFQFGNSSNTNSIQPQQPVFQFGSGQQSIMSCPGRSPGSPLWCPFCLHEYKKGCPYRSASNQPNSEAELGGNFMFVGRVLVGRICRGHPSMRRPPNDESDPQKRPCHTAVNSTGQPTIFVIFESAQCYPEYLIEYRNQ